MCKRLKKNIKDCKFGEINWLFWIFLFVSIVLAIGLFVGLIYNYTENFGVIRSNSQADWGTFGDFIGGLLNPVIAGLALFWLIYSVTLQNKELKKSSEALEETVKTAKKQNDQSSVQAFENLFFQLLRTLENITNDIQSGSESTFYNFIEQSEKSYYARAYIKQKFGEKLDPVKGKESIKDHIIFFKSYSIKPWEKFYAEAIDDYFGSYFRTCYQIVKLIDSNEVLKQNKKHENELYSNDQKKYFDIFRAQLSSYELEAIFFNCIEGYGQGKFQEMIERYGLFEHLLLDHERPIEVKNRLTNYAYKYNQSVFEDNPNWKKYFEEIKNLEGRDKYKINDDKYQDFTAQEQIINVIN